MLIPRFLRPLLTACTWAATATATLTPGFAQVCAGLQGIVDPGSTHPSYGQAFLSHDGSVAALTRELPSGALAAFRWTEQEGFELLDPGSAFESSVTAISGDGQVIIGRLITSSGPGIPFRWRAQGGLERISPDGDSASAVALSFDGSVIVGIATAGFSVRGWRWEAHAFTYFTGPDDFPPIPLGISDDGLVIAGSYGFQSSNYGGFRWDAVNGTVDLGRLIAPPGATAGVLRVEGMSGDGNVIVGSARFSDNTWSGFRWTPATGMTRLPTLGGSVARARAVSADGRTIVGSSSITPGSLGPGVATIWRDGQAPERILGPAPVGSYTGELSTDGSIIYVRETVNGYPSAHLRVIGSALQQQEVLRESVPVTRFRAMSRDGSRMLWETPSAGTGTGSWQLRQIRFSRFGLETCRPAVFNSTGCFGLMSVEGSTVRSENAMSLAVYYLPVGSFGYFLVSRRTGLTPMAGGSAGNLCLSGDIGRFVAPAQVQAVGADGSFSLPIDLSRLPSPSGHVGALAGESWTFQAWHRDSLGGQPTSNFTTAVTVELR